MRKTTCSIEFMIQKNLHFFFKVGETQGSTPGPNFTVPQSNHISSTPRLLYNSTHHSPRDITQLKAGWAQGAPKVLDFSDRTRTGISILTSQPLVRHIITVFLFWRTLESTPRQNFPMSLRNHVGFTPWLLFSTARHSPEGFTQLKTCWA